MIIKSLEEINKYSELVCTSIGGSPIHEGHTRIIQGCKPIVFDKFVIPRHSEHYKKNPNSGFLISNVKLLVIVNSDDFLLRKHGFVFQNENSRAEIIDSIKGVDYTYIHHSDGQSVVDALAYFKPKYFCKGGDRSGPEFMPTNELKICEEIGCTIVYGVGGTDKVSSSSDLMKSCARHYLFEKYADDWLNKEDINTLIQCEYPKFKSC